MPDHELIAELEARPVRTQILNVDTMEEGVQDITMSLDLRDRILASLKAQAGPRDGDEVERVAREMRHYLSNCLEQFTNDRRSYSPDKTSGYLAAKVPDWQLRQWLAILPAPGECCRRMAEALDRIVAVDEPKGTGGGSGGGLRMAQIARAALGSAQP